MKGIEIVSFADDNTYYMSTINVTNLVKDLEDSADSIFNSFTNNQMQGNPTKCRVLLDTNKKVITKVDSQLKSKIANLKSY